MLLLCNTREKNDESGKKILFTVYGFLFGTAWGRSVLLVLVLIDAGTAVLTVLLTIVVLLVHIFSPFALGLFLLCRIFTSFIHGESENP